MEVPKDLSARQDPSVLKDPNARPDPNVPKEANARWEASALKEANAHSEASVPWENARKEASARWEVHVPRGPRRRVPLAHNGPAQPRNPPAADALNPARSP